MSELQDLFEQSNPIPKGITRCGDHYAQTEYMLIDPYASNYAARFMGFMEGVKHQQAIIDDLKAQLNNMEACYIGIKKINDEQSAIIQGHFAARQDMQKRIDEYKKLTVSIRNEFDLWSDDSEFADVIEAQIENLEALRGVND